MTEIKAKISDLREICQLVSLEGKDVKGKQIRPVPEFLMNASNGLIKVQGMDKGNHLALDLAYKTEVINPGTIVIGNVDSFLGFLDRFGSSDVVTLATTENRIKIKRETPYKNASMPLASPESLEVKNQEQFLSKFKKVEAGHYETSKYSFNVKIVLSAGDVKSVVDDGEAVHQRVYPWSLNDKILRVKVGSDNSGEIESEIPLKSIGGTTEPIKIETGYAYGIDNVFGNLTGDVTIYLANNIGACPMIIEKSTDKYNMHIILSPVVISAE